MSKNDLWVICRKDNPDMVAMCVDSKDRPLWINSDRACMHFQTEEAAKQFETTLDVPPNFVGTRPIRY